MNLSPIDDSVSSAAGMRASQSRPAADTQLGTLATSLSNISSVTPSTIVTVAATSKDTSREVDKAQLDQAVETINRFLQPVASSIQFSIDEESGRTLVKVIDTDTNDVLRQFPSKEAIAISSELSKLQGLLLREKA